MCSESGRIAASAKSAARQATWCRCPALHNCLYRMLRISAFLLSLGFTAQLCAQAPGVLKDAEFELYARDVPTALRAQEGLLQAGREFRRYVGASPPPIAVVLLDGGEPLTYSGRLPTLYWFTAAGLAQARSHSGTPAVPPDSLRDRAFAESALPHEACHWYLAAYLASVTGKPSAASGAHRGFSGLPAWYNEGFATLCEPERWKKARRDQIRRDIASAPPLSELLMMAHPKGSTSLPVGVSAGTAEARSAQVSGGGDARARLFYAKANSILQFIAEREGARFVGELGNRLIEGVSFADVLKRSRSLPRTLDGFEEEWRAWVLRD